MPTRLSLACAAIAAIVSATAANAQGAAVADAPQAPFTLERAAFAYPQLTALAERYVAEGKVANLLVGVAVGDADPTWLAAGTLGLNRPAAVDERSIYRIYSMTKPVVGLMAMLLVEDGTIALDQPVAEILPEFADMRVAVDPRGDLSDTRPADRPITIRHLLTHTSGLTYDFNGGAIGKAYRRAGIVPGVRRLGILPGTGPQPTTLAELAERVAAQPLVADPGTVWTYSVGLDIMGAVIEKVTGQSLSDVLATRIFQPLGMADTGFVIPAADAGRLTTNYLVAGEFPLPFPLPIEDGTLVPIDAPPNSEYMSPGPIASGGGGLVSTGADYLTFLRAVADGGVHQGVQLFPASAIEMMTSNLLPDGVTFDKSPAFGGTGTPQGFGAGGRVIVSTEGGAPVGSYGWGGAAGTIANVSPDERISIVLMTQYLPASAYDLRTAFEAAARADLLTQMADAR